MRSRFNKVTNSFWHRLLVRRAGRKDGSKGIPSKDDSNPSFFEKQLIDRGKGHFQQAGEEFFPRIQEIEGKRENAILRLRDSTEKFIIEQKRYNFKKQLLGRDVAIFLSPHAYGFFIGLIVIGEFAMNSQAFDVFGKAPWLTYLMALTVAVGIPTVSHFIGIWLRTWPRPAWVTALQVTASVIITVGCLVGLNIARIKYLESQDIHLVKDETVLQQAFFYINLFIFLAATLMSYFAHDSDKELFDLRKKTRALDAEIGSANSLIEELGAQRDEYKVRYHFEIERIRAVIGELIDLYREHNRRARSDDPTAFGTELPIPNPPAIPEDQMFTPADVVEKIRQKKIAAEGSVAEANGAE
jgi:hypothetical protein